MRVQHKIWSVAAGALLLAAGATGLQTAFAQTTKDAAEQAKKQAEKQADKADQAAKAAADDAARQPAVDRTRQPTRDAARPATDARRDADRTPRDTRRDAVQDTRDSVRDNRDAVRDTRDAVRDDRGAAREDRREDRRDQVDRTRDTRTDRRLDAADVRRDRRDDIRDNRDQRVTARTRGRANLGLTFADRAANGGLIIADIVSAGLAASAGFRQGDTIVSIDGNRVATQADFDRYAYAGGARVPVVVMRDGRETTIYLGGDAQRAQGNSGGAYLGVTFDRAANEALVRAVTPGSPAENAGLRPGDAILSIDGQDVRSSRDAIALIGQRSPGDNVELELAAGNQRSEKLDVTLGSKPGTSINVQRHEVARPITPAPGTVTPDTRYDNRDTNRDTRPRGPIRDRIRSR